MDRNRCPKIIGMGVRNGLESVSGMDRNTHLLISSAKAKRDFMAPSSTASTINIRLAILSDSTTCFINISCRYKYALRG